MNGRKTVECLRPPAARPCASLRTQRLRDSDGYSLPTIPTPRRNMLIDRRCGDPQPSLRRAIRK